MHIYDVLLCLCIFFFKQKTAYEVRISDWSSDVCSSDLFKPVAERLLGAVLRFDGTGVAPVHYYEVALPPYGSFFAAAGRDVQPQYTPERYQVGKNGLRYSQGTIN